VETKLLPDPDGSRVCAQCHERTGELVAHGPYAEGKCLSCHAAHESAFAGLTRSSSADLCLGCHDREIEVPGRERPLPDMAALLCKARFAHGPIRAGDCSPCHNAHAALHANLLREPYPQDFYQIWDASHYALCFRCHPGELAAEARTTTKTGFRDGNRNLHYLHVNREKGRSCRTCHEVHASDLPFHLRASLPFGGWEMPIVYEQRPHGGACKAGCHQEEAYDRTRVPAPGELVRPGEG
jgi:predicted CXXCH cytochrome family protein